MSREVAAVYARRGSAATRSARPVDTGMVGTFLTDEAEWQRRAVHLPDGRFGMPEDIAQAAVDLASDESSRTNGTAFMVDGGISATYTTAL